MALIPTTAASKKWSWDVVWIIVVVKDLHPRMFTLVCAQYVDMYVLSASPSLVG